MYMLFAFELVTKNKKNTFLLTSINKQCEKRESADRRKRKYPYRVGMQHSEEVGAGEELGAGGL